MESKGGESTEETEEQEDDVSQDYLSLFQYIEKNEVLFEVDESCIKKAPSCVSCLQCFHPNYYASPQLFEKATKPNFNAEQRLQVLLDEELSTLASLKDRCIFLCHDECYCHQHKLPCKNKLEALENLAAAGKLRVFKPEQYLKKGYGLQAVVPILKGTFVIEYVGEMKRISQTPIQSSEASGSESSTNQSSIPYSPDYSYLLNVDQQGNEVIVDAGTKANLGRFVNHSCNPNLVYFYVYTKYLHLPVGVAYFAARDIAAGEELTVNYDDLQTSFQHCYCGEDNCKNPPPSSLEPPTKRRRKSEEHEN